MKAKISCWICKRSDFVEIPDMKLSDGESIDMKCTLCSNCVSPENLDRLRAEIFSMGYEVSGGFIATTTEHDDVAEPVN